MSSGWEWKGGNSLFHAQRGYFTLVVSLDDEDQWTGTACIASPGEDETDGVTISCEVAFATKEEAQDAAIDALKKFVQKLNVDMAL